MFYRRLKYDYFYSNSIYSMFETTGGRQQLGTQECGGEERGGRKKEESESSVAKHNIRIVSRAHETFLVCFSYIEH